MIGTGLIRLAVIRMITRISCFLRERPESLKRFRGCKLHPLNAPRMRTYITTFSREMCWLGPTNLGWMMGPWLIYASLINQGTIALYDGAPTEREFGEFVQNARVTMLGVVPSLVKSWKNTGCMKGLNWQAIKAFSSTGVVF